MSVDRSGSSSLTLAVRQGKKDLVEALLVKNTYVKSRDRRGMTLTTAGERLFHASI